MKKTNKGITLIALVITIIVMLILVAVTITMAINGGLFGNAGKAVADTQNAIDKEQELAGGRIEIDGEWYKTMQNYVNGDKIIITSELREEGDSKYIDLTFELAGLPTLEEYIDIYFQKDFYSLVDNFICPDITDKEILDYIKEAEAESIFESLDFMNNLFEQSFREIYDGEIALSQRQGMKIFYWVNVCDGSGSGMFLSLIWADFFYNYLCQILGWNVSYDDIEIEKQILEVAREFELGEDYEDLIISNKEQLKTEAAELGMAYGLYCELCASTLGVADKISNSIYANVSVSNGDSFTLQFNPEGDNIYSYEITEDGPYTFDAEINDAIGRIGSHTVTVE